MPSAATSRLPASSIPLMIISDSPSVRSGLGRITRDIATRAFNIMVADPTGAPDTVVPLFHVATFGMGGNYTATLPFHQYQMEAVALGDLTPQNLPDAWRDFAGDQHGIVLAIGNPTWSYWLSHPESLPENSALRAFMVTDPFERWLYAPIDGHGFDGRLPRSVLKTLEGWDRVLAYNEYGSRMIDDVAVDEATPLNGTPWLPHGIDTEVYFPRPRDVARRTFLQRIAGAGQMDSPFTAEAKIDDDMMLIGAVATNSERKDWPLALDTCRHLLARGKNVVLWAHTNSPWKHWDIPALARDMGLAHRLVITTRELTNEQLAWSYSACDCTLGIGSGEGFGYPLAESLACGVPVLHGNYAGGASFVLPRYLINPESYHIAGFYNILRPTYDTEIWANMVSAVASQAGKGSLLPSELDWTNLWPRWEQWLRGGVGGLK